MFNKTYMMSNNQAENTVTLSHNSLQLVLSPEGHHSNSSMQVSPDSNSNSSNMSDTEASRHPDINRVETRLFDTTSTQYNVIYEASMNMNQTFNATPVNGSIHFWNETVNIACNEDGASKNFQTFCNNGETKDYYAGTSTYFREGDSHLSLCETSCRSSTENDYFSQISGEMVIRSNDVFLDNRKSIFSSLEESPFSAPGDYKTHPSGCNLLKVLTDVCENSSDELPADNTGHPGLGVTFTQADNWELPTEKSDVAISSPFVALPNENERGPLLTFVCEKSSDCLEEMKLDIAGAKPLSCYKEAVTPAQTKMNVSPLSAMQERDEDIYSSTPIQIIGNQTLGLPSFSVSRIGSESSPGCFSVKQPQTSSNHKQCGVVGLTPSASRNKKMDIKTFPKTDYSNVKSKVFTRAYSNRTASALSSQYRPTHVSVNSKLSEKRKVPAVKMSPTKFKSTSAVSTAASNMVKETQKCTPTGVVTTGSMLKPLVGVQRESIVSPSNHHGAASHHAPEEQHATSNTEPTISSRNAECQVSSVKSPNKCDLEAAAAPRKVVTKKLDVGQGSAYIKDKPPVKTRLRCSSDSSSLSRSSKERKTSIRFSTSLRTLNVDTSHVQTKAIPDSSQRVQAQLANETEAPRDDSQREAKKISLVTESSKSASGNKSKGRFQVCPPPRQTLAAQLHQVSTDGSNPIALLSKLRLKTLRKQEFSSSKAGVTPQSKQKSTGLQRTPSTGKQALGMPLTSRVKLLLNGSRPPQTPSRPVLNGPPVAPSGLQRKILSASKIPTQASKLVQSTGNAPVSRGVNHKPNPFQSVAFKARITSTSGKTDGAACKPAWFTTKVGSNSTTNSLRRTTSARYVRPTAAPPADKNKSKGRSDQQPPQPKTFQPKESNGPNVSENDRRDNVIQSLKGSLAASELKFEAVAIVLQQTLIQRNEATSQCSKLSQELVDLKGDLVGSAQSSQYLEKEKEELRVALEDALHSLQEEHQRDVAQVEQRLHTFYQAEWDKAHLGYQEEANKCRTLMQQQIAELQASHEVVKLERENNYEQQLQCVIGQYENSLEELRRVHDEELQSLDKTLKDAEAAVSGRINELTAENHILMDKLTAEENRRKEVAENSQKDLHTLYLEQELESLKVVLDMKTKQLHQYEKKLMEVDKLTEKNMKLDENNRKLQQENEDLKARMERHSSLSRQLSNEQAMLQESLQKESKVNKRLSMENEELLWKLHNGDISSPRKVSPTSSSPSHSFSLQSPHSSGLLSRPPVSP